MTTNELADVIVWAGCSYPRHVAVARWLNEYSTADANRQKIPKLLAACVELCLNSQYVTARRTLVRMLRKHDWLTEEGTSVSCGKCGGPGSVQKWGMNPTTGKWERNPVPCPSCAGAGSAPGKQIAKSVRRIPLALD